MMAALHLQLACLLLLLPIRGNGVSLTRPRDDASFLQRRAAVVADKVPIVTGCQELCGVRDQSCTTSCQVCVEQWSCKSVLEDCQACLEHTKLTKRTAALTGRGHIFDSGGTSMVRDGIKTELDRAEVKEYHSRRELRQARSRVLEAQRQAEWASQERAEETEELKEAKLAFQKSREDVKQWRHRSAKKLKAMRAKREKLRRRIEKTEQDLKESEEDLQQAERQLERKDGDTEANEAEVAKQHRQVQVHKKKVEETEEDLEKQKKDAEWLDRGLKDDVSRSKRGLKAAMTNLRMSNAAEIAARYSLEEAKEHYLEAADTARRSQKDVRRLQANLDNTTLHEQLLNESLGIEQRRARVKAEEAEEDKKEQKKKGKKSKTDDEDDVSDDELEAAPKTNAKESDEDKEEEDDDPEGASILNAEKEGREDAKKTEEKDNEEEKEEEDTAEKELEEEDADEDAKE